MDIEKGDKFGSFLNNWLKIGGIIISAIVSASFAYYMIITNKSDIHDMDVRFTREIELLEERGEKRYKRMIEKVSKDEEFGMYHEQRILELEKREAYYRGLLNQKEKKE